MDPNTVPDLTLPAREMARSDPVRLLVTETVSEALARLRGEPLGERIVYFYVTGDGGRLVGVVPTRRLLLSGPSARIGEIMQHPVFSIVESQSFGEALAALAERKLLALPVVDGNGRLTGVVDISSFTQTLFDLERRETADEVFQMVGVHIEQERSKALGWILRNRFPWLLCNLTSGLMAAFIADAFEGVLKTVVAIAFFVPLVLTLGESVAMQTITISLQSLNVLRQRGDHTRGMFREIRVGLVMGLVSGAIVALFGALWLGMPAVAAVVAGAIAIACAIGAFLGYFVPRLVHRWKLNPKIASGPAALAATDVAVLACYLGLAAMVLS